jgi:hypothetical protein
MSEEKDEEEAAVCFGCGRKLRCEDIQAVRNFEEGYTIEFCIYCRCILEIY